MHSTPAPPVAHGGDIIATARRLGCAVSDLIDMSSNLAPQGMLPGLKEHLVSRLDEASYLPETASETVCELLAARYGLARELVTAGNGTTEFIFALPAAPGIRRGLIVSPTYADYFLACSWAGIDAVPFVLRPEEGFRLDIARLEPALRPGDMVFLCNPNNPTGVLTASSELRDLAVRHPDTVFVVDESYLPFTAEPSLISLPLPDNLVVLVSFSKIFGIPGLRLGFAVAGHTLTPTLHAKRKPWGVNRLAQIAGEFCLREGDPHVRMLQAFVAERLPAMREGLRGLPGIEPVTGEANFILSRLTGHIDADQLRERLLAHRIMIRNCENFHALDRHYFRISLKSDADNRLFLDRLAIALRSAS